MARHRHIGDNPKVWEGILFNTPTIAPIMRAMVEDSTVMEDMVEELPAWIGPSGEQNPAQYPYQYARIKNTHLLSHSSTFLFRVYWSIRNGWPVALNEAGCFDNQNRRCLRKMLRLWIGE